MSQAAVEDVVVAKPGAAAAAGKSAEPASFAPPMAREMLDTMQSAWKRNLKASADATRAFQHQNAEFAGRLLDLNMRAVKALSPTQPLEQRFAGPFELGASALELYMGYLGKSAEIAQQVIALPWAKTDGQS